MSGPYYDCKTCGEPFGFGRVRFEPSECNKCDPPPPREPELSDYQIGFVDGVKECIEAIVKQREPHNKRSSGYNDLSIALAKLEVLLKGVTE